MFPSTLTTLLNSKREVDREVALASQLLTEMSARNVKLSTIHLAIK